MQGGRLAGRIDSEENSNPGRNDHRGKNGAEANSRIPAIFAHYIAAYNTDYDADDSADNRHNCGLHQELHINIVRSGADRFSDADLSSSFCYRNKHDIHDADAANNETDHGNRRQEQGQRGRNALRSRKNLALIIDLKVVIGRERGQQVMTRS